MDNTLRSGRLTELVGNDLYERVEIKIISDLQSHISLLRSMVDNNEEIAPELKNLVVEIELKTRILINRVRHGKIIILLADIMSDLPIRPRTADCLQQDAL